MALGIDRFGNLMDDGLQVLFTLASEDTLLEATSQGGLAFRLTAGQEAGIYSAASFLKHPIELQSERQIYRINADVRALDLALGGPEIGHVQIKLQTDLLDRSLWQCGP